jgi:hypothetical protein
LLGHVLFYNLPTHIITRSILGAGQTGFGHTHGWTTKFAFLSGCLFGNFFHTVFILTGTVLALRHLVCWIRSPNGTSILVIAALLEALTILIHQGVYKYYIINILPLLAILGALPIYRIMLAISRKQTTRITRGKISISNLILFLILVGSFMGIIGRLEINVRNSTFNQRLHVRYLHQMFSRVIPYVDGFGLLSKYNNILHFFSSKRFIRYHRRGKANFEQYFSENFPVLIIESGRFSINYLLQKDQDFIHNNFIPFFGGKFWIYGSRIKADALRKGTNVHLQVEGFYTFRGSHEGLLIDDHPAETPVYLEPGLHYFECRQGCGDMTITYGDRAIDQVIPNFTLRANSSGVIQIRTPGWYYPVSDLSTNTANSLLIDSLPVIYPKKLENHPSIYLNTGKHTYKNPLDSPVILHLLGPLFVQKIHSS